MMARSPACGSHFPSVASLRLRFAAAAGVPPVRSARGLRGFKEVFTKSQGAGAERGAKPKSFGKFRVDLV